VDSLYKTALSFFSGLKFFILAEMLRRLTDCGRSGDFFSKKAFVAALSVRTGMGRLHGKALASAAAVCAVELFRPLISELVPPAIW